MSSFDPRLAAAKFYHRAGERAPTTEKGAIECATTNTVTPYTRQKALPWFAGPLTIDQVVSTRSQRGERSTCEAGGRPRGAFK